MFAARQTLFSLLTTICLVAGCALPQGAGQTGQILKGAEDEQANFAVYPITKDTIKSVQKWPGTGVGSSVSGWISRKRGPSDNIIEAGDKVDITIWQSSEDSLLSSPGQKVVSLPGLTVSSDGTVFLPYVSKVYIAKMGIDDARETIQAKLDPIVPDSQVLVAHTPGRKSTVDLISGVASPGSFPLPDRDFTVMGLIAIGGGVPENVNNPQIRVMRDGKLYGISMDRLMKDPALDTTLRGGDKVFVESEERYFLSLGAAGKEAQVPFPQERLNALDAMALVGGLNDTRANPKGILVLREYSAGSVRSDGTGPAHQRVVFTIDLTSADGLFSAKNFMINDRDVVLVTESPVTTTQTVFGLVRGFFGLANTATGLLN